MQRPASTALTPLASTASSSSTPVPTPFDDDSHEDSFSEYKDTFPVAFDHSFVVNSGSSSSASSSSQRRSFRAPTNNASSSDPLDLMLDIGSFRIVEETEEQVPIDASDPAASASSRKPASASLSPPRTSSSRRTSVSEVIPTVLDEEGTEVIKLDRYGGMARKTIYLRVDPEDDEKAILTWNSSRLKSHKAFIALSECRLEIGHAAGFFSMVKIKEKSKLNPAHCFSLLGAKRSLDLVFHSSKDCNRWIAAISGFLPSAIHLPPCEGRVLRVMNERDAHGKAMMAQPGSLAFSPISGEFLVTDAQNHCVYIFNRTGVCTGQFGRLGSSDGEFNQPVGISVSSEDGSMYICDLLNFRISVLDLRGALIEQWCDNSQTELAAYDNPKSKPVAIHISHTNNEVIIADDTLHKLQIFSAQGEFLASIGGGTKAKGEGEFTRIGGIASCLMPDGRTRIYVSDISSHRVQVFDRETCQFLFAFGRKGPGKAEFFSCRGLGIDHIHRRLYVADTDNHRVQVLDLDGRFIDSIGREGPDRGEFIKPSAVAVCPFSGQVVVVDTGNKRLQAFY